MGMIAFGNQAFQEKPEQRDEVIRIRLQKALGDSAPVLAADILANGADIDTLRILLAAKKSAEASGKSGSLLDTLRTSGLIAGEEVFSTDL